MTLLEQISELKVLLHKYRPPETQIIIPSRLDVKKTIQCLESLSEYFVQYRFIYRIVLIAI